MKTASRLNRRVQLAFGSAILTLLVVGAISYRGMAVSSASDRWVRHSHEVLNSLQNLLLAMENVDSNSRGFVLTGTASYLESCRAGMLSTRQEELNLRTLLADNPEQRRRIPALESIVDRKFQRTEMIISLRQAKGLNATVDEIQGGVGQQITAQFQSLIHGLRDAELRLLVLRDADAKRRLDQIKIVLTLGTVLGLLIAAGAAWSILRDNSGRGLAENALRESEERNRKILDGILDYAIMMMDPGGQIVSWNAGAERIVGYRPAEVIGRNFSLFFTAEQIEGGRPAEILRRTGADGRFEEISQRVRQDGSRYTNIVVYRALRDQAGTLQGFSGIGHVQTETEESAAKYRGLLEAAPDAMVVVNQGGEIVLLNLQAEKQFGYSRHELVGQKVTNIIPEGFAERLIADGTRTAAEALAQQIGTGIELSARRKNGSEFPIEIMLSPLESAEGILITAAIRDISVRKDAETHLAQMESRYRGLLEAAPDAMVVVNQDGEIVLLNVQAEKQFGYSRDELVGQKVTNIIPDGFAERLATDALRSEEDALAQQIGTGIELNGRHKNGGEFPIEIMLSPLESAAGTLVTAAIRDISERKRLEQQLRQSQKMEAVGQLAGGIAHDFNNLLAVIIGYSEILEERLAKSDPLRPKAEQITKAGQRAATLTRQLLAFSRQQMLEPKVLDLNAVVAETLRMLQRLIGDDIELVTVAASKLGLVKADQGQIEQVIINLAVNARDAMHAGGELTITTANVEIDDVYARQHPGASPGPYVMLSVGDTGCGMDDETQAHMFEPFFTTKEQGKGTGLGLSTVFGVVKQSGGYVSVYSEPEQGTSFKVYLPRTDESTASVPGIEDTKIAQGWETVLLVEDAQPLRELARELLEANGYIVLEAENGADAVRVAEMYQEPIHLLFSDVVMPGMNARQLAEEIVRIQPGIKVLYMSGYTNDAIVHRGVLDSGIALLQKPFTKASLTRKVREVLGPTRDAKPGIPVGNLIE